MLPWEKGRSDRMNSSPQWVPQEVTGGRVTPFASKEFKRDNVQNHRVATCDFPFECDGVRDSGALFVIQQFQVRLLRASHVYGLKDN